MDSDAKKLPLGGITLDTTEDSVREHFAVFGELADVVVLKDRATGRGRGFGFIEFKDPAAADAALLQTHTINGRTIEVKKSVPRSEAQNSSNSVPRMKKVFVGGLTSNITEQDFRAYFEQFGRIADLVVMYHDQRRQRSRGFGFVEFDSEEAVDALLQKTSHEIKGKVVEVKQAIPKELSRARKYGGYHFRSPSVGQGGHSYAIPSYGAVPYPVTPGYAAYGAAYAFPFGTVPANAAYTGGFGYGGASRGYAWGFGIGAPAYGATGAWGSVPVQPPGSNAAGYGLAGYGYGPTSSGYGPHPGYGGADTGNAFPGGSGVSDHGIGNERVATPRCTRNYGYSARRQPQRDPDNKSRPHT